MLRLKSSSQNPTPLRRARDASASWLVPPWWRKAKILTGGGWWTGTGRRRPKRFSTSKILNPKSNRWSSSFPLILWPIFAAGACKCAFPNQHYRILRARSAPVCPLKTIIQPVQEVQTELRSHKERSIFEQSHRFKLRDRLGEAEADLARLEICLKREIDLCHRSLSQRKPAQEGLRADRMPWCSQAGPCAIHTVLQVDVLWWVLLWGSSLRDAMVTLHANSRIGNL